MINIVVMDLVVLVALETTVVMQAVPEAVMMIPTKVVDDHLDLLLVMDLVIHLVLVQLPVTQTLMGLVLVTAPAPVLGLALGLVLVLVPVQLLLVQVLVQHPVIRIPMVPVLEILPIQVRIIIPLVSNAGHADLQVSMTVMQMGLLFNVL